MSNAAQLQASPDEPRGDSDPKVTLESLVDDLVQHILNEFLDRVALRPNALKKRILRLVASGLPPYPRPPGRPKLPRITIATEMYLQAKRAVNEGAASRIPWPEIAKHCIPGWTRVRSDSRRRVELDRLRNSVYARLRRRQQSA